MSGRAEHLYERLKSEADLTAFLIGQPEDVNLDAKEWHVGREKECLAKIVDAACGFANASGGIAQLSIEIASCNTTRPIEGGDSLRLQRLIMLAVRNTGRGLAHWPCIFLQPCAGVSLDNRAYLGEQTLWPRVFLGDGSYSLRGKAENIVYPSERIVVATLVQSGYTEPRDFESSNGAAKYRSARVPFKWIFPAEALPISIACDGMGVTAMPLNVPEHQTETYEPMPRGY